ncbi:metal-dependent hydrolase [Solemya velesiana gill symbiont]|uniref:metal-dependent hydrolase n=1 Tax=Solemya velesiana gill symbiont TaxID=1918948 RepID=UPI000996D014|nr:metal-dependent hydrolase [Solemya velesiana gill symbiont]
MLNRRSRIAITAAGVIPDLDGLGAVVDELGPYFGYATTLYGDYHHVFAHNLFAGVLLALAVALPCRKRLTVFLLSLLAFHVHLLCDILGSKGPDGYQWPIPYLYPLIPELELTWSGQWELSSPINSLVGVVFFVIALVIARYRHVTFFELFSKRFEAIVYKAGLERGFFKT